MTRSLARRSVAEPGVSSEPGTEIDEASVWTLLLALAERRRDISLYTSEVHLDHIEAAEVAPAEAAIELSPRYPRGWCSRAAISKSAELLLDLYVPLCGPGAAPEQMVAHVGQSLDGFIATEGGESQYVTGQENIRHLHRMRALFDAVVVGRRTVEADDPRLTTRLVRGEHPTRVVIDPKLRLDPGRKLFTDGAAPTLVLSLGPPGSRRHGRAEVIPVAETKKDFTPARLREVLEARGLRRIFVEGGGQTVSGFLIAGALDRLQVTVAPVIIGGGRPGIAMPPVTALKQALRPPCTPFRLGGDVLFDCELRSSRATITA